MMELGITYTAAERRYAKERKMREQEIATSLEVLAVSTRKAAAALQEGRITAAYHRLELIQEGLDQLSQELHTHVNQGRKWLTH